MTNNPLQKFFYPETIAVVGASKNPGKAGYQVVNNLLHMGYKGKVYPVNPREETIQDVPCYKSILDIPGKLDLLIITVPARGVLSVLEQAIERGDVKSVIVVSAGFGETKTEEGAAMEKRLKELLKESGIRAFGPNCTGVINTELDLDTTIEPTVEKVRGGVSVFSQSGAMAGSILLMMEDQPMPVGFSKWAHVGNMCDIDMLDVLDYYGDDDSTNVICMYMEGFNKGRELIEKASKISKDKAILALKVGRNDLGAKAAFSHTGSIAGQDEVYDAAFRKCGITRVENLPDMIDTAKALSMQPLPKGNRVCILTEAGGPGSMAMDELGKFPQLQLAHISEEGKKKLKEVLPDMALVCEPDGYIDMSAAAMEKEHSAALQIVLDEPEVDAVVLITVPPTFLPPTDVSQELLAHDYNTDKTIMTCFLAGKWVKEARRQMEEAKWPTFDTSEQAVRAIAKMVDRVNYLKEES